MPVTDKELRELLVFFWKDEFSGMKLIRLVESKTGVPSERIISIIHQHYPRIAQTLVPSGIIKPKKRIPAKRKRSSKKPFSGDIYDLPSRKRWGGYTF